MALPLSGTVALPMLGPNLRSCTRRLFPLLLIAGPVDFGTREGQQTIIPANSADDLDRAVPPMDW
jgi:hypothetical protein